MEQLRTYLRGLADDRQRKSFAETCGTTIGHLRNVAYGLRPLAAETCVSVERATSGTVTRRDLRPDDWWLIWPELVTAEHPAPNSEEPARAVA